MITLKREFRGLSSVIGVLTAYTLQMIIFARNTLFPNWNGVHFLLALNINTFVVMMCVGGKLRDQNLALCVILAIYA